MSDRKQIERVLLPFELLYIMKAASDRGFAVHEEKNWEGLSRFTVILPDTRLISSVRYEERGQALARVALRLVDELPKFEPRGE